MRDDPTGKATLARDASHGSPGKPAFTHDLDDGSDDIGSTFVVVNDLWHQADLYQTTVL
jgi:hypothetical protein